MSQENVDLLVQALALANSGDLEAVADLYHPDVELRDLQHPPDAPEVLKGRAAIVAAGAPAHVTDDPLTRFVRNRRTSLWQIRTSSCSSG